MSALWVIPSVTLIIGALVLWRVSRRAADEASALHRALEDTEDARADLRRLRREAVAMSAGYRDLRRR